MNRLLKYDLVYMATPYTRFPGGIEAAFQEASRIAACLMIAGVKVYSPIAHTHPLAIHGGLDPLDHNLWLPFDAAMIMKADACAVAKMETWEESRGITHEIDAFELLGKPVFYLDPKTLEVTDDGW